MQSFSGNFRAGVMPGVFAIFAAMSDTAWRPPRAFGRRLLAWAEDLDRPLPWRGEQDPYRVWLSEMLLQQTRAEQARPYYHRFLELFPDVHSLAAAPLQTVLKAWEGLGYYNRAHLLHQAAGVVSRERGGCFPDTLPGLLALPGVGPYTAAAIASFAFGHPHAVLDGNVIRVMARLSGFDQRTDTVAARRALQDLADRALGKADPAAFNQAIMDFGAVQCTPRQPDCPSCPFGNDCLAWQTAQVGQLPLKKARAALRDRFFLFILPRRDTRTWLVQRGNTDVWRGLYTFPFLELPRLPAPARGVLPREWSGHFSGLRKARIVSCSREYRQVLSHQRIHAIFAELDLPGNARVPEDWIPVENMEFATFALPAILHMYLSDRAS
jgi:A/G-specific adenine glycosylase